MQLSSRGVIFRLPRGCLHTSQSTKYAFIDWRSASTYYNHYKFRTYNDAINLLNTLQTPYAELKRQWDANIKRGPSDLVHTRKCFKAMGYELSELNRLNIVHVAGTKGKGTVCAYTDSILNSFRLTQARANPFPLTPPQPRKIGLYTSPHLVSVRERIRINGSPISENMFTKYFFEVWDMLCDVPESSQGGMGMEALVRPVYFRFLTLMSFHVFLREGVDCAVYETGMGGEYDATNIVERPAVTGITALGIDHTFHLGSNIKSIAWHKAGIFKEGVPAFSVHQPAVAEVVLGERAAERGVDKLRYVDRKRVGRLECVKISPDERYQHDNASLALALSRAVLRLFNPRVAEDGDGVKDMTTSSNPWFVEGINGVVTRGRCEAKIEDSVGWYLDGAHTGDSIRIAAKWFCGEVLSRSCPKVLIFNQQGHRESMELLEDLFNATHGRGLRFDHVIFCPSLPPASSSRGDNINLQADHSAIELMTDQQSFADRWRELVSPHKISYSRPTKDVDIKVLPSLEEAFAFVRGLEGDLTLDTGNSGGGDDVKARVLITGSIHLVGRALGLLEGGNAL